MKACWITNSRFPGSISLDDSMVDTPVCSFESFTVVLFKWGPGTTKELVVKSNLSTSSSAVPTQVNSAHKKGHIFLKLWKIFCESILNNINSCFYMVFKQVSVVNFDSSLGFFSNFALVACFYYMEEFSWSNTCYLLLVRTWDLVWFILIEKYMKQSKLFIIYTFCYALYFTILYWTFQC